MTEAERLKSSLDFVLKWEGGYSNHPSDPGGATMQGITQATYDAYRTGRGLPVRAVKLLTRPELEEIYRVRYWNPAGCSELDWPVCLAVFDTAVNCGVSRATRWWQSRNLLDLLAARARHYLSLVVAKPAQFGVFLTGWFNRLADLTKKVAR